MELTMKQLLKRYKEELNLEEKLKYNDYEGIILAFTYRETLLEEPGFLTKTNCDKMIKYERIIEKNYDSLLAKYPQLKELIDEGRNILFKYFLKQAA